MATSKVPLLTVSMLRPGDIIQTTKNYSENPSKFFVDGIDSPGEPVSPAVICRKIVRDTQNFYVFDGTKYEFTDIGLSIYGMILVGLAGPPIPFSVKKNINKFWVF